MAHLFLSYSRRDSRYVDAIAATLKSNGHRTWIDRRGIAGGEQWRREIVDAIQASSMLLLFLSPNSARSDNVRRELDLADTAKVRIMPVALAPTEIPATMKYQLAGLQMVDVWQDYERGVRSLLDNLDRAGVRKDARAQARQPQRIVAPGAAPNAPDLSNLGGRSLLDSLSIGRLFGWKK